MAESKNYSEMNVTELREVASEKEIRGRSGMDRDELVAALEEHDAASGDGAPAEPAGGMTDNTQRGTGEAESPDVLGDSGAVHESALGGLTVGGAGIGFEGVEQAEAARMEDDGSVANLAPRGAPGPQPPRSAATRDDAKYGQPGE